MGKTGYTFPKDLRHSVFARWCWRQIHSYGSSVNVLVVGKPGSGKSWTTCELSYMLDRGKTGQPRFDVHKDVVFTEATFKALVAMKRAIGKANQWEEAGTIESALSRNWQSEANKETSTLFQIMRHNQGFNIINAPQKSMVDKHMRDTAHAIIVVMGHTAYTTYGKVYMLDMDFASEGERLLRKNLRFVSESGKALKVTKFCCLAPPQEVIDVYEERQTAFKKKLEEKLAAAAAERQAEDTEDDSEAFRAAFDQAKVDLETGELTLDPRKRLPRSYFKRVLKLNKAMATEVAEMVENAIRTGEIQPGVAEGA